MTCLLLLLVWLTQFLNYLEEIVIQANQTLWALNNFENYDVYEASKSFESGNGTIGHQQKKGH